MAKRCTSGRACYRFAPTVSDVEPRGDESVGAFAIALVALCTGVMETMGATGTSAHRLGDDRLSAALDTPKMYRASVRGPIRGALGG